MSWGQKLMKLVVNGLLAYPASYSSATFRQKKNQNIKLTYLARSTQCSHPGILTGNRGSCQLTAARSHPGQSRALIPNKNWSLCNQQLKCTGSSTHQRYIGPDWFVFDDLDYCLDYLPTASFAKVMLKIHFPGWTQPGFRDTTSEIKLKQIRAWLTFIMLSFAHNGNLKSMWQITLLTQNDAIYWRLTDKKGKSNSCFS